MQKDRACSIQASNGAMHGQLQYYNAKSHELTGSFLLRQFSESTGKKQDFTAMMDLISVVKTTHRKSEMIDLILAQVKDLSHGCN